jgi:NAD(P)H-hydrate repair Nnr-like enzyme with NAD(P)H-hydrate dehydratase domain
LLKGADTVIATPVGEVAVHAASYDRAAPWLATAGSGDVLAGLIAGLLARGKTTFQAAQIGAWLHCEAARRFGPGLISEDIPEEIPHILSALGVD